MSLTLMYITNDPDIALIAEKYGVQRIWIDLETLGKEERQKGMNTVKSQHTINDIKLIKPILTKAELLVRINPWNNNSEKEIDDVIAAGADMIMLPMWKTKGEVESFLRTVGGRCKTTLLLETREATKCIDEVLKNGGIDEIHIGLNDLHLSFGLTFMFELLTNGVVEELCGKIRRYGIPYGFGGIAKIGDGLLPAENIIAEHYRLGSTRAILSRTFCDNAIIQNVYEIDKIFKQNMSILKEYEDSLYSANDEYFAKNKVYIDDIVRKVVNNIKGNENGD